VPLPPRDLPVPRERERRRKREARAAPAVDTDLGCGGEPVEGGSDHADPDLPPVQLLARNRPVERRQLGETAAQTAITPNRAPSASPPRRITLAEVAASSSSDERATKAPPSRSPTGVATSKPAFLASRTPGVASACNPRKPEVETKASETRKRRASRRRRAATLSA